MLCSIVGMSYILQLSLLYFFATQTLSLFPKFGEVGSTHPWEPFFNRAPPLKLHCENVNNSAVIYSISLKICTEFKRMTPEVL